MKKVLSILLLAFYLFGTISLSAKAHYCDHKLSSVTISSNDQEDCCCKKMPCSCCTDKTIVKQALKVHQNEAKSDVGPAFSPLYLCSSFNRGILFEESAFLSSSGHIPPLINNQPVYLRNRVFRI